jgi:adenylosuccinate synthase
MGTRKDMALAVIGAGHGDEGKGLAVDALARRLVAGHGEATVVRSNGGAQAGHGVERADGTRHVFHHVGSGALAGAATHLSRFFVAHPMVFGVEAARLDALGARMEITIDPRAPVTTPWDMAINQALEIARGGGRHGSCGLGFGETLERGERGFGLSVADLAHPRLERKLREIVTGWLPLRISEMGLDPETELLALVRDEPGVIDAFLEDAENFLSSVGFMADADLDGPILFEGAQGLALDMDLGDFPHVTRSHTGLPNMVSVAEEAGIPGIRALYMTRSYRTRHGAGPLPFERDLSVEFDIVDATNAPNDWQGRIRTAPLDPAILRGMIRADLDRAGGRGVAIEASLGVSCLDQIRDLAPVLSEGREMSLSPEELLRHLETVVGLEVGFEGRGPCRETARILLPGIGAAPEAEPAL